MMKTLLASVAPLLLTLGACGDDDDNGSSDTAAGAVDEVPQLTFDGEDCVYVGPDQVPAGQVTVELVNNSDRPANVFVARLDEGKTAQDVIDNMGTEPATGSPPPWMSDMGGQRPADAGETMRWESTLGAGEYVANCSARFGGWYGTVLTVIDG